MPEGPPQPRNAFGQALPLPPEKDYAGQLIQMFLGTVGLGDQSKSNLFGQLLGAAVPFVGATKRLTNPIRAYHGSPHDFEKFSLEHIGKGEGAQSYGHGLYFAENPAVAKEYREQLADATVEIAGQQHPVPTWDARLSPQPRLVRRLADIRSMHPDAPESDIIAQARRNLEFELKGPYIDNATRNGLLRESDILEAAVERGLKTSAGGHTYEVNIHASPEQLLDWDKPFSQQSRQVRQKLAQFRRVEQTPHGWKASFGDTSQYVQSEAEGHAWLSGLTGEQMHHAIANEAASGKEYAATVLKGEGIPGLRYRDQGSRFTGGVNKLGENWFVKGSSTPYPTQEAAERAAEASGGVTRNYVLFRDDIIEIAKKYGLALPFAKLIADKMKAQTQGQTY